MLNYPSELPVPAIGNFHCHMARLWAAEAPCTTSAIGYAEVASARVEAQSAATKTIKLARTVVCSANPQRTPPPMLAEEQYDMFSDKAARPRLRSPGLVSSTQLWRGSLVVNTCCCVNFVAGCSLSMFISCISFVHCTDPLM